MLLLKILHVACVVHYVVTDHINRMSLNSWVDYIQARLQLLDGKLYVKYFVSHTLRIACIYIYIYMDNSFKGHLKLLLLAVHRKKKFLNSEYSDLHGEKIK